MPPIKAVFFDLDDTLYDHSGTVDVALEALKEYLPALRQRSDAVVRESYHTFLEEYHRHFLEGTYSFDETHRRRWAAMLAHWEIRDRDAEEMRAYWRELYLANQKLVAGAKELLEAVRFAGVATGIVTNNSVSEQLGKLRSLEVEHLIDHLVISEEVGYSKPNERIFRIALERAGVQPDEAVMVGDHWENDIVAASRLGIRSVWFNRKRVQMPKDIAMEIYSIEDTEDVMRVIFNTKDTK